MTHLRHGRPHRIHGWGLVKAPGARFAQRRYMRLIHYTLTVFDGPDEDTDLVLCEQILVGAQVSSVNRRREIVIRFPNDRLTVQLRTEKEYQAWDRAFRDGSRVADNYYKLVPSRKLGAGAFSSVFFGFDSDDGDHVAIKVVDKTRCSRAELVFAESEARMMAYVRHPFIVQCRDIFDAPHAMHVVMEYMSGSTLEQRMLARPPAERPFSETIAATVMARILSSLAYLEAERICHRDVKPENILLSTTQNDDLWPTSARLSDFGLAAFIDTDFDLTDIVGTPNYVAPEVISRDELNNERVGYGSPVDAWAVGILLFWMLTGGKLPFDGPDSGAIFKAVRAAELDLEVAPWPSISSGAKSLLKGLLHPNPRIRLRSTAARMHPWLLCAQEVHSATHHAHAYTNSHQRGMVLGVKKRVRAAVRAIMAYNLFLQLVNKQVIREQETVRSERLRKHGIAKKASLGEKMQRAPERAPAGADGLGYNVGLFPSFVPKRRARAGPLSSSQKKESNVSSGFSTTGSDHSRSLPTRVSGESGSSAGSLTRGGEKQVSIDRSSVGSKSSTKSGSWGFKLRGRGTDKGS
ncbi:Serine/threonine protein kinase [Chondrus crispus]|uniref:Serine/threonine protein kinase n=1 Tax=Chondrus crispus TaxID=2769 RepID=R7Q5N5_CHOCR|nr:Serine/threonine protein kinase [Chondrus crispus]CDF32686.1 Serine/threonine protein kinase [Chondrus crispus]|eukprot:XP_005712457.1 Serine/threonine protein kinase [Chondrus crispus]